MAKSKSFFGLRRGSTKSLTFSVLDGKQVTKDRVSEVANPRTSGQATQRMKLAALNNFYRGLNGILDHSFEGIKYGNKTRQHFMKLALANPNAVAAVEKGNKEFAPLAVQISGGSLSPITIASIDDWYTNFSVPYLTEALVDAITSGNRETAIPALAQAFNLELGSQLTFVNIENSNAKPLIVILRVILDVNATDDLDAVNTYWGWAHSNNTVSQNNDSFAAAIIVSKLVDDTWQRSTQSLVLSEGGLSEYYDMNKIERAKETYMNTISTAASDKYLNEGESNIEDTVLDVTVGETEYNAGSDIAVTGDNAVEVVLDVRNFDASKFSTGSQLATTILKGDKLVVTYPAMTSGQNITANYGNLKAYKLTKA